MGNSASNARERNKLSDVDIISTHREMQSQAFVFNKNTTDGSSYHDPSIDDDDLSNKPLPDDMNSQCEDIVDGVNLNRTDKNGMLPTVFKWEGGGKEVSISGTFSDWKPIPMVKSHGDFVTIVDLPEGEHEYKFCVDGEWKCDPSMKVIENSLGTKNNLISVKNSDFEVFQALDMDSENSSSANQDFVNSTSEYSQTIPQMQRPWERTPGPPVLPPHLLQIILNKDTPLSCEPTLLPEPNHVMLNHLYALSIKEGVMVLSATHRYRKKYVTTLLYKPI